MLVTNDLLDELKNRVLAGGDISFEEALALIEIEDNERFERLVDAAGEITKHFHGTEAHLCSLVNAKSYLCSEDCAFCSQSVHYNTETSRYELMKPEAILEAAKRAEAKGVEAFCIVTSGYSLSDEEFEQILETIRLLKANTKLRVDGSLGYLTLERARQLKEAGLCRCNGNPQTSREFYSTIVSTHSYEDRLEALANLREGGLELCAGGILGMGESREDRVKMAFELKRFRPECVPVNFLNPRKGTPLEQRPKVDVKEAVKTVAVFRFILPMSVIKLAGGREYNLGVQQTLALKAGANGLITGGYLTTCGNPFEADQELLAEAGYENAGE